MRKPGVSDRPRGTSLMLTALLLPVLIGLVGLAVDTAVLATSRSQLKTVADAAALAGAYPLADDARLSGATNLSFEISTAQSRAVSTGQANRVLGSPAVLWQNSGNTATGDVVVGSFDPNARVWSPPPLADITRTNAVLVTASRSATHGGLVPNYFTRLLGFQGSTISVQSTAIVQNYTISGYKIVHTLQAQMLPIALDQPTYNAMMAQTTTDQYTYNATTNSVTPGPDGIFESKLYPVTTGSPGNWGTLNVGVSDNSTSTLASQIMYGITPAQLATYPGGAIQLDPAANPPSIVLGGNPGISAALQDSLTSIIGKPVGLPIYTTVASNGNNSAYTVVAFGAVRIVAVDFKGDPKFVIVQPALLQDATVIVGTVQDSWTKGGVVRLSLAQ